jgi:hypothetical protein
VPTASSREPSVGGKKDPKHRREARLAAEAPTPKEAAKAPGATASAPAVDANADKKLAAAREAAHKAILKGKTNAAPITPQSMKGRPEDLGKATPKAAAASGHDDGRHKAIAAQAADKSKGQKAKRSSSSRGSREAHRRAASSPKRRKKLSPRSITTHTSRSNSPSQKKARRRDRRRRRHSHRNTDDTSPHPTDAVTTAVKELTALTLEVRQLREAVETKNKALQEADRVNDKLTTALARVTQHAAVMTQRATAAERAAGSFAALLQETENNTHAAHEAAHLMTKVLQDDELQQVMTEAPDEARQIYEANLTALMAMPDPVTSAAADDQWWKRGGWGHSSGGGGGKGRRYGGK